VNKFRKIARWFWLSKERMVLGVMVIVLCFRVYQVLYPPPDIAGDIFLPPGNSLPLDVKTPGTPPRIPPNIEPENYTLLWMRNPFIWVEPGKRRLLTDGSIQEVDLELLRLQAVGDGWTVQIRSAANTKKWYREGDRFESYQLLSIDPDAECVTVFAEEVQRRTEICKE